MRSLLHALPPAFLLLTAPALADAQKHVAAAQKAEERGEWKKALAEWRAAYAEELNSEYLIPIGDACAKLGDAAEAKKAYQQYLSDGMALASNVERVEAKFAALDAPVRPSQGLSPLSLSDLRKKKPAAEATAEPSAKDVRPPAVAVSPPGNEIRLPSGKGAQLPAAAPATSSAENQPEPPRQVAIVATPGKVEADRKDAHRDGLATTAPGASPLRSGSSATRKIAWITAGVAIGSLGGGALAYTRASSAHSELTGSVHTGAQATGLLEDERRNRTLSFVGLAGGFVAAGVSAALFAF